MLTDQALERLAEADGVAEAERAVADDALES